jgi:hypothetical protein
VHLSIQHNQLAGPGSLRCVDEKGHLDDQHTDLFELPRPDSGGIVDERAHLLHHLSERELDVVDMKPVEREPAGMKIVDRKRGVAEDMLRGMDCS